MRIKHKYIRNRLAKIKARNRVKKFVGGEFSIKCYCPYWYKGLQYSSFEQQIIDHNKFIDEYWVRNLVSGGKRQHAPKWLRNNTEHCERRTIKQAITKILKSVENVEIPTFNSPAAFPNRIDFSAIKLCVLCINLFLFCYVLPKCAIFD